MWLLVRHVSSPSEVQKFATFHFISACSETDAAELVSELNSLTEEIALLQRQASMQSDMLSKICEDPRIAESLNSIDYSAVNGGERVVSDDRFIFVPQRLRKPCPVPFKLLHVVLTWQNPERCLSCLCCSFALSSAGL